MRYVRIGTQYEPGLQELAVELLRTEVHAAIWKQSNPKRQAEALAFIKGSGLETVIEVFGLPIEPANFRNAFTQCLSQKSMSSSAIILAT